MSFLMNKEQLRERLEAITVIDCRFILGDPSEGDRLYRESHIPGAYYFDLEKQLSGPVEEHGGRHPLPDVERWRQEIEKVGIDRNTIVVVYDEGDMQFASRFWWLLTYLGHERVYLLEEGFSGWKEAGYPVTEEVPEEKNSCFTIELREEMLASYEEVKEAVQKQDEVPILIDSRARERYLGEIEPIDRIPGHIPGAVHHFWGESLQAGTFKNKEEQQKRFADLDPEQPVIVYCGSGVTAAPNYLALKQAGFQNVKLYAGSYSDWVSYPDNPVEKGEEK